MKPLVIYHKGCSDGVGAASVFYNVYGNDMEYFPGVYNELPPNCFDRVVYFVDFSYKREIMEDICDVAESVILLDHHKSALDDLKDLKRSNFFTQNATLEHSGAVIAWKFVMGDTELPPILKYIQDRDLWKFEFENTRPIIANLFSYELTLDYMANLIDKTEEELEVFAIEGRAIERKYKVDLQKIFKGNRRQIDIAGITVDICNAPPMYSSDIGNMLAQESPGTFGATYHDTKYKRLFSLRSVEGGMDVSKIAEIYGGGGHIRAAGFNVSRDHFLAKI